MNFKESISNGYIMPTSIANGSGEAIDVRCVCDTVEDFKSFLDDTGMELRYEGLITYEKVNKLLKVYKGNDMWQIVGEGGGSVDTSSFITLTQLSQQLNGYYTKSQTDNKISEEIAKAQIGGSGEVDGLELKAEKVTLADRSNLFDATNVEDALLENKTNIQNANSNISKLQSDVSANKTNISSLQSNVSSLQSEINGQRLRGINIANAIIDKLEG